MSAASAQVLAAGILLTSACNLVLPLDNLSGASPSPDDGGPAVGAVGGDDASSLDSASPELDAGAASTPDSGAVPGPGDAGWGSVADSSVSDSTNILDSTGAPESSLPNRDATVDAPGGGPGPPPPFCASQSPRPLFCEDFDEDSVSSGWSSLHSVGGSVSLDTLEFRTPPGAMSAQSGVAANGGIDVAAYRSFALAGASTFSCTLDLDLRVDNADGAGGFAVLEQLGLSDGSGGDYFVQLVANSHGGAPLTLSINEVLFGAGGNGQPTIHPLAPTIALGSWTHVTFAVVAPFGGGTGAATIAFDGAASTTTPIAVGVKNFTEVLGVGLTFVRTPSNGWTAIYDDVTFDAFAR
jgi:hypothetical protein